MKNKYQRMNKEEKHKLYLKYIKNDKNKLLMQRLMRIRVIGIIGCLYSCFMVIFAIITSASIFEYIYAACLLVFSIIFIINSVRLKTKYLNDFAIKQK